ncbi:DUF1554 domain-containing protein [Leptospira licerasiae]|uniref:DUF1554 domain-containing protein n=2 Tax=Leptospira licerasiae TaxID=447106 RepID=UPI003019C843
MVVRRNGQNGSVIFNWNERFHAGSGLKKKGVFCSNTTHNRVTLIITFLLGALSEYYSFRDKVGASKGVTLLKVFEFFTSAKRVWIGLLVLMMAVACQPKNDDNNLALLVVLVNGNSNAGGTCATTGHCMMFATTNAGGMTKNGGIAGVDNNCSTDANKPAGGGTYKALVTDGVNRRACTTASCSGGTSEHLDWVLKPNKEYRRKDGTTVIGTTTANGVFTFPLTNSVEILANLVVTNGIGTGMNADWTSNANDCSDWSTNAGGTSSTVGTWDSTGSGLIGGAGTSGCSNTHMVVCVEQ